MIRLALASCFTLIAAIVMVAAGPHGTIPVDDFDDGDDVGWKHEDFTPAQVATFDASAGSYTLDSAVAVPIDDPFAGTVDADWEPSEGRPRYSNGTLRGTVRANTAGSTVGLLLRADDESGTDYGFYGSTGFGTFYIARYDFGTNPSAPQTIIAMADPAEFPFVAGQDYRIEATVVGSRIRMKAWKVGAPEPADPMLSLEDKGLKPSSGSTLCVIAILDPVPLAAAGVAEVRVSGTFDDITFTPGKAD
jgi:hypothetical protein